MARAAAPARHKVHRRRVLPHRVRGPRRRAPSAGLGVHAGTRALGPRRAVPAGRAEDRMGRVRRHVRRDRDR